MVRSKLSSIIVRSCGGVIWGADFGDSSGGAGVAI
jgi:hypothetical protein